MRILNFLKPKQNKRFVSEIDFINNRDKQSHLAVETLVGLRELNVEEGDSYPINFWFHVGDHNSVLALTQRLQKLNYTIDRMDNNEKQLVVSGRTTPIKMTHEALKKWAIDMCILGYEQDCHFEKWQIRV